MKKVKEVVQIVSGDSKRCPHCGFLQESNMNIGEVINHYFTHGYKLLHVGQETTWVQDNPWQKTVAVLATELSLKKVKTPPQSFIKIDVKGVDK